MQRRFDWPDVLFGLFLILVATITLVATRRLAVGNAADMGPGYMPRVIGFAVAAFGLFFTGRGLIGAYQGVSAVRFRSLLCIAVSVAVFALLAERAGLVLAAFASVAVAAFATPEVRKVEALLFAAVMAAVAVLLFIKVLALPVPVWPPSLIDAGLFG